MINESGDVTMTHVGIGQTLTMGKELKDANDNVHHHFSYYQEQKMLTIYTNELKHTRGKTESFLLENVPCASSIFRNEYFH